MTAGPPHRRLDHHMQAVEPDVKRDFDTAQYCRFDIGERDLKAGDGVGGHAASVQCSRAAAQCHGSSAARSALL
jgi:hypothetical protein